MYRVILAMSSLLRLWNEWQRELKFGNACEKLSLHSQQEIPVSLIPEGSMVANRETREPMAPYGGTSPAMVELVTESKKRGLMPFINFNRMHVVPPCIITEAKAKEGLAIIDEVLTITDKHYAG